MAFCLKIKFVCQRSECASALDPQASLLPVLSIITLNHLKSGCHDVKRRGDVYWFNHPWGGKKILRDGPEGFFWNPKGDWRQNPEFDSWQWHSSPIQAQQCCRGMRIFIIIPREQLWEMIPSQALGLYHYIIIGLDQLQTTRTECILTEMHDTEDIGYYDYRPVTLLFACFISFQRYV